MPNPPTFSVAVKADAGARAVHMHFEGYTTTVGHVFRSKKERVWKGWLNLGNTGGYIEGPSFRECKEKVCTAAEDSILRMADEIREWRVDR